VDNTFPAVPVTVKAGPSAPNMISSLALWAAAADDGDELEVALLLAESGPFEGDAQGAVVRARQLLLLGRPRDSLVILDQAGFSAPADDLPTSWAGFVLAACRAATGDTAAYRALLSATASTLPSPDSWRNAYLVAAAESKWATTQPRIALGAS
jgi:hypothetical protein